MDIITRSQMEQDIASDLRWLEEHDANAWAAWEAVVEDSSPETTVRAYDLGNGDFVHIINDLAIATYGQSEPRIVDWDITYLPLGLVVIEDGAGGLWLYGRTKRGEAVHCGDLSFSDNSGVVELVMAYHEGIAEWEHGQDNDQPLCFEPQGSVIAEYDGISLTLHTLDMGYAGRKYFLREAAKALS